MNRSARRVTDECRLPVIMAPCHSERVAPKPPKERAQTLRVRFRIVVDDEISTDTDPSGFREREGPMPT